MICGWTNTRPSPSLPRHCEILMYYPYTPVSQCLAPRICTRLRPTPLGHSVPKNIEDKAHRFLLSQNRGEVFGQASFFATRQKKIDPTSAFFLCLSRKIGSPFRVLHWGTICVYAVYRSCFLEWLQLPDLRAPISDQGFLLAVFFLFPGLPLSRLLFLGT